MLRAHLHYSSGVLLFAPIRGLVSFIGGAVTAAILVIPDWSLQAASPVRAPDARPRLLDSSFQFTEGPAADSKGNVYFTDQPNDRIMIWTTDGRLETFMQPAGRSNGLYFDLRGNLLACADEKNQLWEIDSEKNVVVLVKDLGGKLLNGPNDLWVDPNGGVYFTDPFYKRDYWGRDEKQIEKENVYFLPPNRSVVRVAAGGFIRPNGMIGSPDGRRLYVADLGGRQTYVYEIGTNGVLSNRKPFVSMGSDGMTMDAEGNVYLTGRGVTVFDSEGKQIDQIPINKGWTANVCFGGERFRTLFITAMDSLFALDMKVGGAQ